MREEKIYGYCRISRKTQNIERQIRNIVAEYPNARIYQEAYTGTKIDGRKEFEKMLTQAKKDIKSGCSVTIVFDSVSRMSRNAEDGTRIYFELYELGINLVFLKESYINTDTYKSAIAQSIQTTGNEIADIYIEATNKVIKLLAEKQIVKAFEQSQKEVDDLHERTVEGIETARRNGKQIGQKSGVKLVVKKAEPTKNLIRQYSKDFDGTLNDKDTIKIVGVARNTYYRYKKEMFEELTR